MFLYRGREETNDDKIWPNEGPLPASVLVIKEFDFFIKIYFLFISKNLPQTLHSIGNSQYFVSQTGQK